MSEQQMASSSSGSSGQSPEKTTDQVPLDDRLTGFNSLRNVVDGGTPEVQKLLNKECELIMSCRICNALFRSLPNFIKHKNTVCRKRYDTTNTVEVARLVHVGDITYDVECEVVPGQKRRPRLGSSIPSTNRGRRTILRGASNFKRLQSTRSASASQLSSDSGVASSSGEPHPSGTPNDSTVNLRRTIVCHPESCDMIPATETAAADSLINSQD